MIHEHSLGLALFPAFPSYGILIWYLHGRYGAWGSCPQCDDITTWSRNSRTDFQDFKKDGRVLNILVSRTNRHGPADGTIDRLFATALGSQPHRTSELEDVASRGFSPEREHRHCWCHSSSSKIKMEGGCVEALLAIRTQSLIETPGRRTFEGLGSKPLRRNPRAGRVGALAGKAPSHYNNSTNRVGRVHDSVDKVLASSYLDAE